MKIIKQGDLKAAKTKRLQIRKFVCPDCGCVFTADNTEYTWGGQRESGPYMDCPCCGKKSVDADRMIDNMVVNIFGRW